MEVKKERSVGPRAKGKGNREPQKNVPFVRGMEFPSSGRYVSQAPNRRQRRMKAPRDFNNSNSTPTVVVRTSTFTVERFIKRLQFVPIFKKGGWIPTGFKKVIHYDRPRSYGNGGN